MSWSEKWETLKELGRSDQAIIEKLALREKRAKEKRWDWALHNDDKSSGSETLDD